VTDSNRTIGWTTCALGALTGLVLGLWSFNGPVPTPQVIGQYGDVSRRLIRLGHIACFGLGFINIHLANELHRLGLSDGLRKLTSRCMNFGNVFLPLTLFAAGFCHPLKYTMSVPATSVSVALCLTAYGVWRRQPAGGAS
jgi:hypothetical protein